MAPVAASRVLGALETGRHEDLLVVASHRSRRRVPQALHLRSWTIDPYIRNPSRASASETKRRQAATIVIRQTEALPAKLLLEQATLLPEVIHSSWKTQGAAGFTDGMLAACRGGSTACPAPVDSDVSHRVERVCPMARETKEEDDLPAVDEDGSEARESASKP
jgi:hypothetical protein